MIKSQVVSLDLSKVNDWDSFHDMFKAELGFPDFYGRNMDAWIDCMGDVHEENGMTNLTLPYDTSLTLNFTNSKFFKFRHPKIYRALRECTDFVNKEHIEHDHPGAAPILLKF